MHEMNIGFIYTKFYPLTSSASVHGYQIVKNLKNLGHEIVTIGVGKNDLTIDFPKSILGLYKFYKKVDVIYIRINPWLKNDWFTLFKLISLGNKKVIWELNAPVEEVLASYAYGVPAHVQKWIDKQNYKRRLLAGYCDAAIGVSKTLADYSNSYLNIKSSHSIPNGSDPDLFKPGIKDNNNPLYSITKDKFVVVWAGNGAITWQGTNLIGEVAKEIYEADKDIIFIVISNQSIYNSAIAPNIISLGEIPYLLLPQFLNFGHLALCLYKDYNWCPYGFYGSSLKLFDFMSMGLPVIASNMGQLATVVEDGRDGYLTDNSTKDIIRKIVKLKQDPSLRLMMGNNARNKIINNYNWKDIAIKTSNIIESALNKK